MQSHSTFSSKQDIPVPEGSKIKKVVGRITIIIGFRCYNFSQITKGIFHPYSLGHTHIMTTHVLWDCKTCTADRHEDLLSKARSKQSTAKEALVATLQCMDTGMFTETSETMSLNKRNIQIFCERLKQL